MDIVLNELSLQQLPKVADHAISLLNAWLSQMLQIVKTRKVSLAFRSTMSFMGMQIADDGTIFQQWLGKIPAENKSFALSLLTKAPFIHDYPEYSFAEELPLGFKGQECKGLAYAVENNLLAWSFDSLEQWIATKYKLHCTSIDEAYNTLDEYDVLVWHLPVTGESSEHTAYYAEILAREESQIVKEAVSGITILNKWHEWFPSLQLTTIAQQCLEELFTDAVRPVVERLIALQHYFATWDGIPANYNLVFNYRTSRESDTRLRELPKLQLQCPDGQTREMNWHIRYTPQEGRLYFVPDTNLKSCYIGYIGHKIV